jgi:hypothetical protein
MLRVEGFVEGEVLLVLRGGRMDCEVEGCVGLGFIGVELFGKGEII